MLSLSEAANTWGPALELLRSQGFTLRISDEEAQTIWIAERAEIRITASDPLTLLGLASLWSARGADWRTCADPGLYDRILDGEAVEPGPNPRG